MKFAIALPTINEIMSAYATQINSIKIPPKLKNGASVISKTAGINIIELQIKSSHFNFAIKQYDIKKNIRGENYKKVKK